MEVSNMNALITVVEGDITTQDTDAIVNAANQSLLGGGGVDGAIHKAAGPGLLAECRKLGGCDTGDARTTSGHLLPAKWVIHAVGPIWSERGEDAPRLLASAYRRSLEEAVRVGARTVAFPAISTGVYGYPKKEAAEIAVSTIRAFLASAAGAGIDEVRLVCFSARSAAYHRQALARPERL